MSERADRPRRRRSPSPKPIIGWREWATLVDLCPVPIKAKVDTGARTSSLHAFNLRLRENDQGLTIAEFEIHPTQRSSALGSVATAPVVDMREVRSSTGHRQRRPVIRTTVAIGTHRFPVEISLTSRDEMGFRMLLGRSAIRRRFLVDPGRSYQQGRLQ